MGKKIFVGNLSFDTTSADLESLFAHGNHHLATSSRTVTPGRSAASVSSDELGERAQKAIQS